MVPTKRMRSLNELDRLHGCCHCCAQCFVFSRGEENSCSQIIRARTRGSLWLVCELTFFCCDSYKSVSFSHTSYSPTEELSIAAQPTARRNVLVDPRIHTTSVPVSFRTQRVFTQPVRASFLQSQRCTVLAVRLSPCLRTHAIYVPYHFLPFQHSTPNVCPVSCHPRFSPEVQKWPTGPISILNQTYRTSSQFQY